MTEEIPKMDEALASACVDAFNDIRKAVALSVKKVGDAAEGLGLEEYTVNRACAAVVAAIICDLHWSLKTIFEISDEDMEGLLKSCSKELNKNPARSRYETPS